MLSPFCQKYAGDQEYTSGNKGRNFALISAHEKTADSKLFTGISHAFYPRLDICPVLHADLPEHALYAMARRPGQGPRTLLKPLFYAA